MKVKKWLAVLCGMVMLCSSEMGLVAYAQENEEVLTLGEYEVLSGDNIGYGIYDISGDKGVRAAMLNDCTLGISVNANGVRASVTTGSTVQASKIGVRDVVIEKYVNGKWEFAGSHPGGYVTNKDYYAANISTGSADKGVKYRISCTHYAVLNGVEHALSNVTNGVSY